MSLFNRLTYMVLWAEIVVYLLSLIPLSFLSHNTRKDIMNRLSDIGKHEYVLWTMRLLMLVIVGVFVDNFGRLLRLEHGESHGEGTYDSASHGGGFESAYAELQQKYNRFYSQRNVYLSSFTLFMVLVLYRRFRDLYRINQLELEASLVPKPIGVPASGAVGSSGSRATAAAAAAAEAPGSAPKSVSESAVKNDTKAFSSSTAPSGMPISADAQLSKRKEG